MNIDQVITFVEESGLIMLAILSYIEYLNIPGFPGGIVIPAAGIIVKLGYAGFVQTAALLVFASMLSELTVYGVSYIFSGKIESICLNHERSAKIYQKAVDMINKHGALGIFSARLIPVIRTFISIPSGLMKMKLREYIPVSLAGNALYVTANMALGYFFTSLFV